MPRTKSVAHSPTSLAQAWADGGEIAVTRMAVQKYAEVIDVTESGRDMKPLITGMFEAIDRLKSLEAASKENGATNPLFEILDMAAAQDTEIAKPKPKSRRKTTKAAASKTKAAASG